MADRVRIAADVARVPELGDQLKRDTLARPADPQRWMRLLDAFRLVDRPVDRVLLPLEDGVVLGPHPVNDLAGLLEHAHALFELRKAVTVGPPFVLVPAGADPGVQPPVAGDVHRGGDLGVERGVAIAVAADHLADAYPFRVPHEGRRDRPAFESGLRLRFRNRMEVVVDPDRVPRAAIRGLRHLRHRLILLNRILDLHEVHAPTLGDEDAKFHSHGGSLGAVPVEVGCAAEGDGYRCMVDVSDATGTSHHAVRVSRKDFDRWRRGRSVEELVAYSFAFLLERDFPEFGAVMTERS